MKRLTAFSDSNYHNARTILYELEKIIKHPWSGRFLLDESAVTGHACSQARLAPRGNVYRNDRPQKSHEEDEVRAQPLSSPEIVDLR